MFYVLSKAIWLVLSPSVFLLLLITVPIVWAAVHRSVRAIAIAIAAAAALLTASCMPIGSWLLTPLEQRFPLASTSQPPDGIIAIAGDGDSGERTIALVMLSRKFPGARIVYSGEPNRDEFAKQFSLLGGDASRLIVETSSRNTEENARYTAEIVEPAPDQKWLLITSAFHMPRAIGCFRKVGFHVEAYPVAYLTSNSLVPSFGSKGVGLLDLAAKEWVGLVAYRLFHKTDALYPAAL
jgi:uncharacterized SAM-binding protein YcdF (DUF218 family)